MPIFDNHPSLDRANLSNSQPKHLTIASISSVLKSFLEQIANRMWLKEAKNFVSNPYRAVYFCRVDSIWKNKNQIQLHYKFFANILNTTFF